MTTDGLHYIPRFKHRAMPSTPPRASTPPSSLPPPTTVCTSTVSVKPPTFMAANPTAWFVVMEAQFHLAHVTLPSTRFYHALAALPPEVVGQLPTTILTSQDYSALKDKVVELYESSKPEILDRFLRDRPMTGKPSHYLGEMTQLATKVGVSDELVRHKFQQALPPTIGPIIASQKTTPLPDLGKLADELCALTSNLAINRVHDDAVCQASLGLNHRCSNPVGLSHASQDLKPFSSNQRPKICRAHIYYAERARTCRSWCRWPVKDTCTVSHSARNTPQHSPRSSRENSPTRASNWKGQLR